MKHVEIQFQGGTGKFYITPFNGTQVLEAPETAWKASNALTLARSMEERHGMEPGDHTESLEYYWVDENKRARIPAKSRPRLAVAV